MKIDALVSLSATQQKEWTSGTCCWRASTLATRRSAPHTRDASAKSPSGSTIRRNSAGESQRRRLLDPSLRHHELRSLVALRGNPRAKRVVRNGVLTMVEPPLRQTRRGESLESHLRPLPGPSAHRCGDRRGRHPLRPHRLLARSRARQILRQLLLFSMTRLSSQAAVSRNVTRLSLLALRSRATSSSMAYPATSLLW